MGKIFVCSDTHFNHANIIKYCNRPYETVEEMDEALVDNWNSVVTNDDTVFFLGDFALGSRDVVRDFVSKLNGRKILVRGNHDHMSDQSYKDAGFETVFKKPVIMHFDNYDMDIQFSHAPVFDEENQYPNIYGHVHDKPCNDAKHYCVCMEVIDYKPIELDKVVEYFKEQ